MIPLVDLKAQYLTIKSDIAAAVGRVLDTGQFVLGPEVEAFEQEFAAYQGAAQGIAVNTGTSALHLALLAAGVGPGDEVITVPFTFVATVAAIGYVGARAVYVDIDPKTFTMDVNQIEGAITPRTKAIVPVHLYGQPADMDPILEIANRHGLKVIEDGCQAHGAAYKGRPVGALGDLGCFSFYPGKNLGAYGEGGMVVTNNAAMAKQIRMLRDWGSEKKYHHVLKGFNYRMEGMQGAILRVKLRHLEKWTEARRAHAVEYRRAPRRQRHRDSGRGALRAPRLPRLRDPHQGPRDAAADAAVERHRHRHPLPDSGPPPAGLRGSRATGRATSRTRSRRPTRCCRCRCSPSCRSPTSR